LSDIDSGKYGEQRFQESSRQTERLDSMVIVVGCCGFAVPGGMRSYYREFDSVEIQSTFYNIARLETIEKWRIEAPPSFEFVPKAFQGITHPSSSSTWKRFRGRLSGVSDDTERYGFLRPTEEVVSCWKTMIEICARLRSEAVLLQTPPSFSYSETNVSNMEKFLTTADRKNVAVCWEPRGDWNNNPEKTKQTCSRLDLVHVTDVMRREPTSEHEISYIRLHGLNTREFDYKYAYNDQELFLLRDKVSEIEKKRRKVYVFFNNTNMADDARKFKRILHNRT
jgi:uncharacterized protein YecE (DUF72 family)